MPSEWENEIQRYKDEGLDKQARVSRIVEEIEKIRKETLKKYWPRILVVGKTFAESIDRIIVQDKKRKDRYTLAVYTTLHYEDYDRYRGIEVRLETGLRKDGSISSQIIIECHVGWKTTIPIDQFSELLLVRKLIGVHEGKIREPISPLASSYADIWRVIYGK